MARPLADVVLAEEADEGVEIVRVERRAHLFERRIQADSSIGPRAVSSGRGGDALSGLVTCGRAVD
jgi:hypothetical protein